MPGMPVPEWADDLKKEMFKQAKDLPKDAGLVPINLQAITCFTTHFAEWFVREDDVLIHFFPRAGENDTWEEGHYISKCRRCGADLPKEISEARKPCGRCGHTGLVYVPGRKEDKAKCKFPDNTRDMLKAAVDEVWMGDLAIDYVEELGAFIVQLQSAKNTLMVVGPIKFVDKICEEFDKRLGAE